MLEKLKDRPELKRYLQEYQAGQVLFLEGDDSQDLYVLMQGQLGVYKGNQEIATITEPGALFGEMSFLLGGRRTATVKALDQVKVLRVPREQVGEVLGGLSEVGQEVSRLLARRLNDSGRILQGLKELTDRLPEAVVITDAQGAILTWNAAAEELFGGEWRARHQTPLADLFLEPAAVRFFLEEVQRKVSAMERVFEIDHPHKGRRAISLNTTCLLDAKGDIQGLLTLGRDVTAHRRLERSFRRLRMWLIPILMLLALMVGAAIWTYPYLHKGYHVLDTQKQQFRTRVKKDFMLLRSLLMPVFEGKDLEKAQKVMKDFFKVQVPDGVPYRGLVLLDADKRVFEAYSPDPKLQVADQIGSTYARLKFRGPESSIHKVLTVYRTYPGRPGSYKSIELAFEMTKDGKRLGWLVMQLDAKKLKERFDLDEHGLVLMKFGNR